MIKVSISYKYEENANFDHAYYSAQHLPMVKSLLGDACIKYEIDKGVCGPMPGSAPDIIAACHLYTESTEKFYQAFSAVQKEILRDVKNYTEITPAMQVNEVSASE
ncbi:EthD family reductase [Spongiibacter sp. KMU-166]|uniref:EthD family reductase n=1 Tax=Spongiibacter thalassae TaxID=2721624 RepID=A0ABX1GKH5_9GAMM|nr:EthD family reductase [Spongiibacter thalassae]NKI18654.1 EthD family reductase [Spongiibacter thalassae]